MRITTVLGPFLPVPAVLGGAVEKVHLLLAHAFSAAGHDVTIVSRQYKGFAHDEHVGGVRHIRIPSSDRSGMMVLNLARDFRYAVRAARRLPQADITITNSFSLPLVLPRARAGKIYVHVARFPKGQMWLYRRADRLQAVSRAVADEIVRQTPSLADRVVAIGNPLPDIYFAPSQAPRQRTVLYVGRVAREKGVDLLVRAFASLAPDERAGWTLRIVGPHEVAHGGDGAGYLSELKVLAQPLAGACEFTGPIFDQGVLPREYRSASIFAYPSIAARGEALPLAPLEAMATGCATVVSGLRCFDDYITPGVSGLIFDHRSADAARNLADELRRLMGAPDLRANIASEGHASARRFHISAIAARMIEDFEALIAASPR